MFVVNKNSWHYKLLKAINEIEERRMPKDFCTYWRQVIVYPTLYFLSTLGIISMLVVFATFVVYPVTGSAMFWIFPASISFVIFSVFILFVVFSACKYLFNKSKINKDKIHKPNIFQVKYRSFKDKICPMIQYEKE